MSEMPSRYAPGDGPQAASVPVTVVVLTLNEDLNIARCLESVAWARQVIVVDSGSSDATVETARELGADVVETHWRGFGPQREYALRLPLVRYQWVFFVDADEWISSDLAREIESALAAPGSCVAYWQYFRLVFQGRWIRHCGWYPSARVIRLMRRSNVHFDSAVFSEHPHVDGRLGRLHCDLVDEDLKGLAAWLHKHVNYAQLEADRRNHNGLMRTRLPHEPRIRFWLKDRFAPNVPARPLVQFVYMYFLRRGFLDGRSGLAFCFYHAWFQWVVSDMRRVRSMRAQPCR